ncbi:PX domain-containing protein [Pseudohyphozyma bogoriensis]|nr:PX domain-containing protein [Pseudohyphozyma bogoriensis]
MTAGFKDYRQSSINGNSNGNGSSSGSSPPTLPLLKPHDLALSMDESEADESERSPSRDGYNTALDFSEAEERGQAAVTPPLPAKLPASEVKQQPQEERSGGPKLLKKKSRRKSSVSDKSVPAAALNGSTPANAYASRRSSVISNGYTNGMVTNGASSPVSKHSPASSNRRVSLPGSPTSRKSLRFEDDPEDGDVEDEAEPQKVSPPRSPKQDRRRASSVSSGVFGRWGSDDASSSKASTRRPSSSIGGSLATPNDRHYLNRQLAHYGEPFLPYPNGPNSRPPAEDVQKGGYFGFWGGGPVKRKEGWEDYHWEKGDEDSPVLRYMCWRFIYNFPVLRTAKREYWTDHIQPFFDSFAERDLSTTKERSEVTKRRLLSMGLSRILGTYFSTCITSLGRHAPSRPTLKIMKRIDHLFPGSMDSMWRTELPDEPVAYNAWTAVVGQTDDKDFIIVSKVVVAPNQPEYLVHRSTDDLRDLFDTLLSSDPTSTLEIPLLPPLSSIKSSQSTERLQKYLRLLIIALSAPPADVDSDVLSQARSVLEKFLCSDAEEVTKKELKAYFEKARKEDEESEKDHDEWVRIGKRGKKLRTTWSLYRGALINGDEVDKSIALVRKTPEYKHLPEAHRDAQEFAAIWVSYALHFIFSSSPNAAEAVGLLKSFHSLIPYGALKLGLSLVNPTLAIKAIVALVLGQPGGQASLFQRIFSAVVGGGIKVQKKEITELKKKLNNDVLAQALEAHVYAAFETRAQTRSASLDSGEEIVVTIVREYAEGQLAQVQQWATEFERKSKVGASGAEHGQDESGAGRFQILKNLLRAYCLKRDREQVLEIVYEHNTPVVLKESISVFYGAIYKIADASKLADRLGDIQAFIDDLLKVAQSDKKDASDFIKLSRRHDQQLYYFVYELATNGGTLLDPLLEWCKSGLGFIKSGIPSSTPSTPSTSKRAGLSPDALLSSLPAAQQSAVVSEVRTLAQWTRYRKVAADISFRGDLLDVEGTELGDRLRGEEKRREMYDEVVEGDWEVWKAVREGTYEVGGKSGKKRRAEDQVRWAWWGVDEVLEFASEKALAGRKGRMEEEGEEEGRKEGKGKGREKEVKRVVPEPSVDRIKDLLGGYVEQVRSALDKALEDKVL